MHTKSDPNPALSLAVGLSSIVYMLLFVTWVLTS